MILLKYQNKYYNTSHIFSFYLDERGIRINFDNCNTITVTTARQKYIENLYSAFKTAITSSNLCDVDEMLKQITSV